MTDENNCVLITGSNKGLGKELAIVFANANYDVILHGRNKKDLEGTKKEIVKKNVNCDVIIGDLKEIKTIEKLYDIAEKKDVSILINNAGLHCPHLSLEEIKDEQIDDIVITNLIVPIKLTKRIYKLFLKRRYSTIININSLSGIRSQKLRTIYCSSKWGLKGFTDTFRLEAKDHNVRVIEICPGRIKTRPEFAVGMDPEEVAQKIYDTYKNTDIDEVILDGRLKK